MVKMVLTSNYAAAYGAKLARVQLVAAYPITPQTTIVEKLDEFIEKGELDAKMVRVESEHSAMATCIGGAAAGVRAYTATSSHGLFYMYEMLWWAAGARLPIVMGVVMRALAPPWTIWTEYADLLALRDSGWLIFMAENAQEVLDLTIQAFKIAENEEVLLPVMIGWDAFIASHTAEPVDVPDQEIIDKFLPPRTSGAYFIDGSEIVSIGNLAYPDVYMEFRYSMYRSIETARDVIGKVGREYGEKVGRDYSMLFEDYKCEDAKYVFVSLGSMCGDIKDAVDYLRDRGEKVGLCRIRTIRPFPGKEISRILEDKKGVIVLERDISMGHGGIIATDLAASLYLNGINVPLIAYTAGLGGREVNMDSIIEIYSLSKLKLEKRERTWFTWYGVKKEVM